MRITPDPHTHTHLYLIPLPLPCSLDCSLFCSLKVSTLDIMLCDQLTSDTSQAAESIKPSNWVPLAAVYWQNKTWELGMSPSEAGGPAVFWPVNSCPLSIHHWLSLVCCLCRKMVSRFKNQRLYLRHCAGGCGRETKREMNIKAETDRNSVCECVYLLSVPVSS